MKPEQRPTAQNLAATRPQGGLECPQCGCRDFRTRKTIRGDGVIQRRRECRHCGHRLTTIEQR